MQGEFFDLSEFRSRFQTEDQCREFLFKLRWPDGFVCPKCAHTGYYRIKNRRLYHCGKCGHQASVMANTIFHRSHLPLVKWFAAIFIAARDKDVLISAKLADDIDVSYPTAWLMLHKIRSAMADSDSARLLSLIAGSYPG